MRSLCRNTILFRSRRHRLGDCLKQTFRYISSILDMSNSGITVAERVAGSGEFGRKDGPALEASFCAPCGLASGPDGTLYIADEWDNCIRMLKDGQVTTIAGTGDAGLRDGPALEAQFFHPKGLALSEEGHLYIADYLNNRIRLLKDGIVTTIAGRGKGGLFADPLTDGPALEANSGLPHGLALRKSDGALFIADFIRDRVRMLKDGILSTVPVDVVGPHGLAFGPDESLYISASARKELNGVVQLQPNGQLSAVAGLTWTGFTDGPAEWAQFHFPYGIACDSDGTIWIADYVNRAVRALKDGRVTTVAGGPLSMFQTGFGGPEALSFGPDGTLYIADSSKSCIWDIKQPRKALARAISESERKKLAPY